MSRDLGYQIGLIGFPRFRTLLRLTHYLVSVHPRYLPRVLLVLGTSLLIAPLRAWESLRYGRRIARVRLEQAPIFIVGHWRSGTTHLHNLMSRDPALGSLTMYQAMVPGASLAGGGWLKSLLATIVPVERPMDNMTWPVDAAQEEEIPLAKMMPRSFYTRFLFPRKSRGLFKEYVLLEGAGEGVGREIEVELRRLLQVATLHAGGKRLVLKNPVNTARLRMLVRAFPGAKFIHAYRNPYDVFASTRHLHRKTLAFTTLQTLPDEGGETVLGIYEDMMRRYLADRALLPEGSLVEVRFEDLERDPVGEVRRIYSALGLPGFAEAEHKVRGHVASQKDYKKNRLTLSEEEERRIGERWAFAFEALGYARRGAAESASASSR